VLPLDWEEGARAPGVALQPANSNAAPALSARDRRFMLRPCPVADERPMRSRSMRLNRRTCDGRRVPEAAPRDMSAGLDVGRRSAFALGVAGTCDRQGTS
jgi:hypothetical protein